MLEVGFGRVDFTPSGSVPLAGYAHLGERRSRWVRDPLYCRALALSDGKGLVVLLTYDLLIITEDLYQDIRRRLADLTPNVIVHATHTHSSVGGYIRGFLGERFAGHYRPYMLTYLADAGERAARKAISDLREGKLYANATMLCGLNPNRRDPKGPRDQELVVLRIDRGDERALLVNFSAHPVIAGEKDHYCISADYPGETLRLLEEHVDFAAFLQGSLGGVGVLFREDQNLSDSLAQMAAPIANSALQCARLARPLSPPFSFARIEWDLGPPAIDPFFEDEAIRRSLLKPLQSLLSALVPRDLIKARVQGLRVGPFALLGTPADLGARIALTLKEYAKSLGIEILAVASQCDGYIGYVHSLEEYKTRPEAPYRMMAYYENAMSFFGHRAGMHVQDAAFEVLKSLSSA